MNNWISIITRKLQSLSSPLPENDWEEMSALLDSHIKKRNIRRLTLIAIPAAASIVAAIMLTSNHQTVVVNSDNRLAVQGVKATTPEESGQQEDEFNRLTEDRLAQISSIDLRESNDSLLDNTETSAPAYSVESETYTKTIEEVSGQKGEQDNPYVWTENRIFPPRKKVSVHLLTSVLYGNNAAQQIPVATSKPIVQGGSSVEDPEPEPEHVEAIIGSQPVAVAEEAPLIKRYTHSQPRTLGLSINYALNERINLSSGIDYSICYSSAAMSDNTFVDQKAYYVGVPLHIDYLPVQNKYFKLYFGVGGEARRCVHASFGEERIKDNGFRFSAIGLAGLRYEPVRNVGLFIEPKYLWNIKAKDPIVRTAYTDSRTLFTFEVGVCFSL